MADTTTHVTTPSELCESADFAIGFEDEDSGTHTIILDNDIDFNDEDYYYHKDHFMYFKHDPNHHIAKTKIIDLNNKTISNIFVYTTYSFIYYDMPWTAQPNTYSNYQNIEFKNGTFEVVLNGGSFLNYNSNDTGMSASHCTNATNTKIEFRNCTFNIKGISFGDIFYISTMFRYMNFINCTFNLDLYQRKSSGYNSVINFSAQGDTSDLAKRQLSIESCQFKIRLHREAFTNVSSNIKEGIIIGYKGGGTENVQVINMNNCIFFITQRFSHSDTAIRLLTLKGFASGSSLNNNFISSLEPLYGSNKEYITSFVSTGGLSNKGSFFVNSDKIGISSSSYYNVYTLSEENCKSPTALAEAGYTLANDA